MVINYKREMSGRGEFVTPEVATGIVRRHLDKNATVTTVRKLYGGSISRVLEFAIDGPPGTVVAKVHDRENAKNFHTEMAALCYFLNHSKLPVPAPLVCIDGDEQFNGSALLMQHIPGTTLEAANLSTRGRQVFEAQLATHIADLHTHHSTAFGNASGTDSYDRWIDLFSQIAAREAEQARSLLSSKVRPLVDHIIANLPRWLASESKPTLIHGDLWANNIMINDAHPDRPVINAYIDGHASFADPEYELAYLRLFQTAGSTFFDIYTKTHKLRPGFEKRCRVYWLVTLLQHCRMFGGQTAQACEKIAKELHAVGP